MYFYGFDIYYFILVLPAILLAGWAQLRVKSTYSQFSQVTSSRSVTGAQAAGDILRQHGITDVQVERVEGQLTDHFDPKAGVIRLSDGVYGNTSIAAIGIAAHEAGHAVQHAEGYLPGKVRNAIVPVANIGSSLAVPLIIAGLILSIMQLVWVGIIAFSLAAIFQIVTLPVEYNASSRAIAAIDQAGILTEEEIYGARKVLSAAALTYVAALLVTLMQLLRFVMLANGGRRRR